MSPASAPVRSLKSKGQGRSAISNGSRLLEGIDGRSVGARRFRDLMVAFAEPYGGLAALSEPDQALVRQAASLTLESERLQAAIARGEPVDGDLLIRLASEARRALKGLKGHEAPSKPSLGDYLAAKRGAAA